ncbi:LUD domain-containing protein [uncultured Dokdonia sp.]|uniref:LUD domain-containing protein n=1 Tax=uncultured Dokdonia sp. TaxID=575653 RepID=UPI0030EBFE6C|tara:strand:- start:22690 stop:23304 length:615 start_codon:yes stop_codon:yes gene_type:complete
MSLFRKIFGNTSKSDSPHNDKEGEVRSKYMPDINTPADERFTKNFIINGGRFLYALNQDEIHENFDNILLENDWYEEHVFCTDDNLKEIFKGYNLTFGTNGEAPFFLTTCESLVANDGSLLVCSKQLKELKLNDLPENIIVFGTTSQIVNTIGEGLRLIKNRNSGSIPTNITTIKNFESKEDDKDFMTYGSSTKNLYLLLLEDL